MSIDEIKNEDLVEGVEEEQLQYSEEVSEELVENENLDEETEAE